MTRQRADWPIIITLWVLAVLGCVLFVWAVNAYAHPAGKGWDYPWECCSDHDCAEIAAERVRTSSAGYVIDGRFTVPQSEVRISPDGRYHACFPNPDTLRCFFAPSPSY